MEQRIRNVLAKINPKALDCIGDDIVSEIGIDSHDIFNIIMELEEEFNIDIDPLYVKSENFKNFDSIKNMIQKIMKE